MRCQIGQIADVRSGYQFRGKVETSDDANVRVIQIKDVDPRSKINYSDLVAVRLENPDVHILYSGDVLFLSRGGRLFATIVTAPPESTIASGYFYVLRPNEKRIRPGFLAWTINQPDFQDSLRPLTTGSHIALVSKANFQDLTIPLPSLAIQDKILTLQHLVDREIDLNTRLMQKRSEFAQAVARNLLAERDSRQDNIDEERLQTI